MKNTILRLTGYLYYLSLLILILLYLFPGSLIGYLFYGDLSRQPQIISNSIGSSINHLLFFSAISLLLVISKFKNDNLLNKISFIFILSFLLELTHLFIPNRAFEIFDLLANILGVLIIFSIKKVFR